MKNENKTTATEQTQAQELKTELTVTGKIILDSFIDEESKEKREFVSCMLDDPFGDEDFINVKIKPKWQNDEPMLKFNAKKALRTEEYIPLSGTVYRHQYKNKAKKLVSYIALMVKSPFEDKTLEFICKDGKDKQDNKIIFSTLADKLLTPDVYPHTVK